MSRQELRITSTLFSFTAILGLVAGCSSSSKSHVQMNDSNGSASKMAVQSDTHNDNRGIASMNDRGEETPVRLVSAHADAPSNVDKMAIMSVSNPPPVTPSETPPRNPSESEFWVPGHWRAESGQYVWAPGRIERYRDGTLFHPAKWNLTERGWEFTPEFWQ